MTANGMKLLEIEIKAVKIAKVSHISKTNIEPLDGINNTSNLLMA